MIDLADKDKIDVEIIRWSDIAFPQGGPRSYFPIVLQVPVARPLIRDVIYKVLSCATYPIN
jgi:hypothetical protein